METEWWMGIHTEAKWFKDHVGKALEETGGVILTSMYAHVILKNSGFPKSLTYLKCQTQFHFLKFRQVRRPPHCYRDPNTYGHSFK